MLVKPGQIWIRKGSIDTTFLVRIDKIKETHERYDPHVYYTYLTGPKKGKAKEKPFAAEWQSTFLEEFKKFKFNKELERFQKEIANQRRKIAKVRVFLNDLKAL